jgi:hypothetical protein
VQSAEKASANLQSEKEELEKRINLLRESTKTSSDEVIFSIFSPCFLQKCREIVLKTNAACILSFFSAKMLDILLKTNFYDHFFRISDYNLVKKSAIFWQKYFKNCNIASRSNGSVARST